VVSAQAIAYSADGHKEDPIAVHARVLSSRLQHISETLYPPKAEKPMRSFSTLEVAKLLGLSDSYVRQMSLDGFGPTPAVDAKGKRSYSLAQVNELRRNLADAKPKEALNFLPGRRADEKLQVIACTNFKGGSAKTTTTIYLAQFLALRGYRVLAIDLDPQASMTALFGIQPEFALGEGDTLYGAIQYDDDSRRPMKDIIRRTYFDGLDLVPGNLELMEFEHSAKATFFTRISDAIREIEDDYDVVVIDCPPQLGYLTLSALVAATSLLITIHPQMVDIASMSQFLAMASNLREVLRNAGANTDHDFVRYVITRHEPHDGPQSQVVALLRSLFGTDVLAASVWKSSAIADAGLTHQTLYELDRGAVSRDTFKRAIESVDAVNNEILGLIHKAWGRV
jgi:chromosome partitioning protein